MAKQIERLRLSTAYSMYKPHPRRWQLRRNVSKISTQYRLLTGGTWGEHYWPNVTYATKIEQQAVIFEHQIYRHGDSAG